MELRDFLEAGATKAGSLTALGKLLDMSQPTISNVKAYKRPLPIDAVLKLADYINADLRTLIAANELVTERKEEKRAYWRPFVDHARAASIASALTIATVANLLSPTPAEASPLLTVAALTLCIMLSRRSEKAKLHRRPQMAQKPPVARFLAWTGQPQPI